MEGIITEIKTDCTCSLVGLVTFPWRHRDGFISYGLTWFLSDALHGLIPVHRQPFASAFPHCPPSPLMLLSTSQSCSVCAQTAEPGLQTPPTPGSAKSVRAQHEEAVQGSKFLLPNQSFHPGQEALVPLLWFCKKTPKNKKPTKKKKNHPMNYVAAQWTINYWPNLQCWESNPKESKWSKRSRRLQILLLYFY